MQMIQYVILTIYEFEVYFMLLNIKYQHLLQQQFGQIRQTKLMSHFKQLSKLLGESLKKSKGNHVYLLRHAQAMGNHAGTIIGWTDSRLSIKGRQQANQLFQGFHSHLNNFTSFHSSDLVRCRDTTQLALGYPMVKITESMQIRQLHFGDDEGVHFDSLPDQKKQVINSLNYAAPNGQNWVDARKRGIQYLKSLGNGHHFVCTHGGLMCSLTYQHGIKHVVPNGSVLGLQIGQEDIINVNFHWQFPKQE